MTEAKKYRITPAMSAEAQTILLGIWQRSGSLKHAAERVRRLAHLEETPNRGFISSIARGKKPPPGWLVKALGVRYMPISKRHSYTRWQKEYLRLALLVILLLFILREKGVNLWEE